MPSASAPGTALRRSFTLPSRLANPNKAQQQVEIGSADGIETLFVHPSAKIVSFSTASSLRSRPSSRSSIASYDGEADASTSLLWTSPTERTMAAGPLEIYRVPGSVAFLHSGSLLHAILPRSQCWCVDGVSKFAMRVLPNTYYRIELPGTTQEDLEYVEQLKKTLAKVLYYERTACPFQRGFGEDLPEMPSRNSRRLSREFIEPAKRWRLDKVWRPEGAELEEPQLLHPNRSPSRSDTERSEVEDNTRLEEESGTEQDTRPASREKPSQLSGPFPGKKLAAMRSVTAPPQLSLDSSPPSKVNKVRKMAGIFDQTARDTVPPLARPLSSALVPRLPPTPESADDHDLPLNSPDYHIHENITSDEQSSSTPVKPVAVVADENDYPNLTEPLIIVEQVDDEPELEKTQDLDKTDLEIRPETDDTTDETLLPEEHREQAVAGATESTEEAPSTTTEFEQPALSNHPEETSPIDGPTASPSTSTTETTSATFTASSPALSTTSISTATSWSTLPVLTPSEATDLLRQRRAPSPSSSPSLRSSSPPAPSTQTPAKPTTSTALTKTSPALLVRKTCALFLGPPANLVATMLRIAARLVASGALNLAEPAFHDMFAAGGAAAAATAAGRLRGHRRVPGSWDLSDDDEDWGF
ncbi:hypothetical protein KCU98_g16883, partial [Aureobasidium melanogenum]